MESLRFAHRLLLGAWVGATLFFGAVVAPTLFRVFAQTPKAAADVVRELLPVLESAGVLIVLAVLVIEWVLGTAWGPGGRVRLVALLLALALGGAGLGVVSPRLAALRAQAQDRISELAPADPVRREFGRLHGVSSTLLLGQLLCALVALAVPLRRREDAPGRG